MTALAVEEESLIGDVVEEGGEVGDEGELVGAEDEGGLLGQVQQPSDHI